MLMYSRMLNTCEFISHGMLVGGVYDDSMIGYINGLYSFVDFVLLMKALVIDIFHFFQHFSGGLIWFGYVIFVELRDVPFNAHRQIDVFVGSVISDNIVTLRYSRQAFNS